MVTLNCKCPRCLGDFIRETIHDEVGDLMRTIQEVLEQARQTKTLIGSLNVLFDGVRQRIEDILAGVTLPAQVQAQIDETWETLDSARSELGEVVTENTPLQDLPGTQPPA